MRQVICDSCKNPIERGTHAADGFQFELEGLTIRVSIDTPAGKERPDWHQECARKLVGRVAAPSVVPVLSVSRRAN